MHMEREQAPLPQLVPGTLGSPGDSRMSPPSMAASSGHPIPTRPNVDGGGDSVTSTCVTPRRLLQRQQQIAMRGTQTGLGAASRVMEGGATPMAVPTAPRRHDVHEREKETRPTSAAAAPTMATVANAKRLTAIPGMHFGSPKDFADMGGLKDLSPTLLYCALLTGDSAQEWRQPSQVTATATATTTTTSAESPRKPTGSGCGADTESPSDDEDVDTDPLPVREAKAERRIARQQAATGTAMQAMFASKDAFYSRCYAEGQRQQQLAREEVAAYGKELGEVEAISQLTPQDAVDEALTRMQADPTQCEAVFDSVVREDFLLREMHMAIIRTKLKYQVDNELECGHQHLRRACDTHLSSVIGSTQGPS